MSNVNRYTRTAMVFHWSLAFLIIAMLAFGWSIDLIPPGSTRHWFQNLHKLVGCVVLLMGFARIAWRITHRPPEAPSVPRIQAVLAALVHLALYGFMLVMPLSGLLFTNYGRGVKIFSWSAPQVLGAPDDDLQAFFLGVHGYAPYVFLALIVVHIAAALWHQFVLRDKTINRMLPE